MPLLSDTPRHTRRRTLHVHRFHRLGDDPFGGGSHYGCRCGVVRSAF